MVLSLEPSKSIIVENEFPPAGIEGNSSLIQKDLGLGHSSQEENQKLKAE
jgi:hypothetical protein